MPAIYIVCGEGAGGPTVSAKDLAEAPILGEGGSITATVRRTLRKAKSVLQRLDDETGGVVS